MTLTVPSGFKKGLLIITQVSAGRGESGNLDQKITSSNVTYTRTDLATTSGSYAYTKTSVFNISRISGTTITVQHRSGYLTGYPVKYMWVTAK